MEVHALCAAGPVAAQAPVPNAIRGQQVPRPLMAPAAERQETLILKHLRLHDAWQHQPALNVLPMLLHTLPCMLCSTAFMQCRRGGMHLSPRQPTARMSGC